MNLIYYFTDIYCNYFIKNKKIFTLLIITSFNIGYLYGQSFTNYSVTRNTSVPYNSIVSTGTSVPNWRNTGGFSQDDNRSFFIPIGFEFWYNGVRYTQLSISTNGFIDFSSSTDDGGPTGDDFGYVNSAFTQPTASIATRPAIAPMYDDMTAQGGVDALGNSIKYQLSGSAPNRVFTMEWINMAVYGNTSPSLNFQVKLHETSGIIEFLYGTMNSGTHTFSYTCGLNGETMSTTPTNAQLKAQQTVNSSNFTNGEVNNLITIPASNSQIIFTPVCSVDPGSTLTFSAITQTSMTLNWTNWSSNEVGYVIYGSIDGINYYFNTQTAANATSTNITGLFPGTTYYWQVYAVTEGCLSNAVTNSQITNAAGTKLSNVATGNWNTAGSWTPSGVPTASDNVIIRNGHTITINTNATCNDLTVGQSGGTLRIGNNNTSRTITVNGNINVTSTGNFSVNTGSNTTHNLSVRGNIINDNILDFNPDGNSRCNLSFFRINSQTVSGTGGTNNFYNISLDLGSATDSVSVTSTNFTVPSDFLTLNSGYLRLNTSNASTYTFTTAYTIGQFGGLVLDNPNATFSFQDDLNLLGEIRLMNGTINIGNAANENIISDGGNVFIRNGVMNVAGRYFNSNLNNLSSFSISGGTFTLPTSGSTSTSVAPFEISSNGSSFNMSGGSIIIEREGGTGGQDLGFTVTNTSMSTVTGGVLQIGNSNTPANQTIEINSSVSIGGLLVNSNNATAKIETNDLTIINDVNITAGTLDANLRDITLGGNWINSGTWLPTTANVTFNGNGNHTITNTNSTTENFHHLGATGSGTTLLNDTITLTGNLNINANATLDVSSNNFNINCNRHFTNNGSFIANNGMVSFLGTQNSNLNASNSTSFYNLRINKTANTNVQSGDFSLSNALFLTNGLLDVSSANSFTLLSDALSTARIAPVVSGTVSGNFTIQRYIDARSAGYSDISSPVTSTNFQDWGNELLLVYAYNPPNAYPSCWGYSESLWDYVPITSATTNISSGAGYEVWLDSDGTYTSFNNTTVNSIGVPNIGNMNIGSSMTNVNDGWNLIGNPYASFISWDALHASSSNISNSIMIFDETIDDYQIYTTGTGIEIAPHQGFWVQATGAPSLSISESHKTSSNSSSFRLTNENFNLVVEGINSRLKLKSHAQFNFDYTSNDLLDEKDVSFIGLAHPLAQDIYSVIENKNLRLNILNTSTEEQKIQVNFDAKENARFKISRQNIDLIIDNGFTCVILVDKKLGREIDLMTEENYEFDAFTNESINRFELILSKNGNCKTSLNEEDLIQFETTSAGINVILSGISPENASIQLVNSIGQNIESTQQLQPGNYLTISSPSVTGIYFIYVTVGDRIYTKKFYSN